MIGADLFPPTEEVRMEASIPKLFPASSLASFSMEPHNPVMTNPPWQDNSYHGSIGKIANMSLAGWFWSCRRPRQVLCFFFPYFSFQRAEAAERKYLC